MWVEIKKVHTLVLAEMWKLYFEGEGLPARIMPEAGGRMGREFGDYVILVPEDRIHVAREVLGKL